MPRNKDFEDFQLKNVYSYQTAAYFLQNIRVNRHALAPTPVRIARTYVKKFGLRQQRIRRIGPRYRQRRRQQVETGLDLGHRLGYKGCGFKTQ